MTGSWTCTYDNLVTAVLSYLERQDPAVLAQLPVAISLAEFDIATKLKTLGQLSVAEFAHLADGFSSVLSSAAKSRK